MTVEKVLEFFFNEEVEAVNKKCGVFTANNGVKDIEVIPADRAYVYALELDVIEFVCYNFEEEDTLSLEKCEDTQYRLLSALYNGSIAPYEWNDYRDWLY